MQHYVCDGTCGAVSEEPGTCQDVECTSYLEDLRGCDCDDNLHENPESQDEEEAEEV